MQPKDVFSLGGGRDTVYLTVCNTENAFSWATHSPGLFGFHRSLLYYAYEHYLQGSAGISVFLSWVRAKQLHEDSGAPTVVM